MRRNLLLIFLIIPLILSVFSATMIGVTGTDTHDIAVVSVTPSQTSVKLGELVNVTVIVENQGTVPETFTVEVYYDHIWTGTRIGMETVSTLEAGANKSLTFTWDTTEVGEGDHTLIAWASEVHGEEDTENNLGKSDKTVAVTATLVHEVIVDGLTFYVVTESNSIVSNFDFNQSLKEVSFDVTAASTTGFCNVTIPNNLLWGVYTVFVDGTPKSQDEISQTSNSTHNSIYFTFTYGAHSVRIEGTEVIPEFPTLMSLLLILAILTASIVALKRRTRAGAKIHQKVT